MGSTTAEVLKRPYGRTVFPEPDGTFRAEIIEFPGCIAVGDTAAGALTKLEDVAESWLEAALARKQTIPDPIENVDGFSGKLVLRIPKSLHKRAAHMAASEGVSLNQFILSSLAEQIGGKTIAVNIYQQIAAVFNPFTTRFFFNIASSGEAFDYARPMVELASPSAGTQAALYPYKNRNDRSIFSPGGTTSSPGR